jgi:3-phenylpropionate/cinnamic acid dioxygenase small subunit
VLSDPDRIRNLLGRYCELIDAGDLAGVGALFAQGALADEHGVAFARGATAVEQFYRSGMQLYDGRPLTKHVVADTVVEEADADGTVAVRSSYVVFQATDGFALQPIIAGRYHDRFGRDAAGRWHFVERRFVADLVGDMSHHWHGPGG